MGHESLLEAVRRQYALEWDGIHGVAHWLRVRRIGLALAPRTGADPKVVELFAVLHDACRLNDRRDPGHGPRAAELARAWRGRHFDLGDGLFAELCEALHGHTDGRLDPRPNVGTCWDADRLDLRRAGIEPKMEFLSMAPSREAAFFQWAVALGQG
jgi:uncharacterized protein